MSIDIQSFKQVNLERPEELAEALIQLRQEVFDEGRALFDSWCAQMPRRSFRLSALNFAYYLALRRRDLRALQDALRPWGVSSLGRLEGRVMPNLDAVIATMGQIAGLDAARLPARPNLRKFYRGERLLNFNTEAVFGKSAQGRRVRIMVTLPSEAAHDYALVRDLAQHGMDCARINCAHDDTDAWEAMIANLRRAEAELGTQIKVAMDLGGPKSRTASLLIPRNARLRKGDTLLLTREKPVPRKEYPYQAQCTLVEAFEYLKLGSEVWFDDGKLGTKVESIVPAGVVLRVTQARSEGEKLKDAKGINFPGTRLRLDPLTEKDLADLDFMVEYADIIHYSFVQEAEDIARLQKELALRTFHPERIAIVAKIETAAAVENLPSLIVQAGGQQPFGIMIARGDLAVEIGFQRMAEMQEEILWLAEAAHVPVIWATQVLETLAKKGRPTRAEITDAAMGERAECVMLNKGPHVLDAVKILDDVLRRMEAHQNKKSARLRALRSW